MNPLKEVGEKVKGVVSAVTSAAIQAAPDRWMPQGEPDPLIREQHGNIGRPVSRIDGPLKVAGGARYAAEFPLDGMLYAAVAFSTIVRGRIAAIDTVAASTAPGVALVMTHENAPRMNKVPLFGSKPKAAGGVDLPIMQDPEVYWNGQPIAVVLAATQEQADHAKSLLRLTYEEDESVVSFEVAKAKGTDIAEFQGQPLDIKVGDAEQALADAPFKVDHTYVTPRHSHNAIELHACTVAWEGETLRVHDASQLVAHTAWSLSQVFGLEEDQVHVTSPFVGGGFGGKCLWDHQVLAAAASKLAGRPVRLMLSREGVYRVIGDGDPAH